MLLNSSLAVNISATLTLNFDSVETPSKVVTLNCGDIITYKYFNTESSQIETVTGEIKNIILLKPVPEQKPLPMEHILPVTNYIESIRFTIDASSQYESKIYKILAKDILDIILPVPPVTDPVDPDVPDPDVPTPDPDTPVTETDPGSGENVPTEEPITDPNTTT